MGGCQERRCSAIDEFTQVADRDIRDCLRHRERIANRSSVGIFVTGLGSGDGYIANAQNGYRAVVNSGSAFIAGTPCYVGFLYTAGNGKGKVRLFNKQCGQNVAFTVLWLAGENQYLIRHSRSGQSRCRGLLAA